MQLISDAKLDRYFAAARARYPKRKQKPANKRLIIWAAKSMFKSAYKLATALKPETDRKVLIIRSDSPRFKPRNKDVIVNWGNSYLAEWDEFIYTAPMNDCQYVQTAVNKLETFQALQDKCNIPTWTTDWETAYGWWQERKPIVARHTLTGFGGDGIVLYTEDDDQFDEARFAKLYVQYKKKKKEFRVHVFKGEIIDVTQKKKRKDFEGEVNTKIRNYGNGWVYCREDIVEPNDLREQAIRAVQSLGLDFGAVDAIYNEKENKSYVLEVNTAPGLEGTTIEAYKNAILKSITIQNPLP